MNLLKRSTVSNKDIVDFIGAIMTFSKENTEKIDSISKGYAKSLEQTVSYIDKNHAKVLDAIKGEKDSMVGDFELNLAIVKALVAEVKRMKRVKGKDGKDADEESIIQRVLTQIKLPEYKDTVLDTGKEIVEKINELEIKPELQIDASHIKNLPTGNFYGGSGVKELVPGSNVTIDNSNPGYPVISSSGGGGGGVSGQATVNFGASSQEDSSAVVTVNTASVSTSSIILVSPSGVATADHDIDDYQWDNISGYVTNIINGVSFDIKGIAPNGSWGQYVLNYVII
jgi:hypothetical protein